MLSRHAGLDAASSPTWIPAFAGMTEPNMLNYRFNECRTGCPSRVDLKSAI
jgi:hypothetical protein